MYSVFRFILFIHLLFLLLLAHHYIHHFDFHFLVVNLSFHRAAYKLNSNLDLMMLLVELRSNIIFLYLQQLWFWCHRIRSILDWVKVSVPMTNNVHNAFQIHNVQQYPSVHNNDSMNVLYDMICLFMIKSYFHLTFLILI